MDRSLLTDLLKRPDALSLIIVAITAIILIANGFGLMIGITNVFPHLFYIPIILTAYFFPRRGILFSIAVSLIYCGMTFYVNPDIPGTLLSAGGRVMMFILIAAVVSFLTTRLRESERQFRGVAERSSDIILLTDITGKARYVSPSIRTIAGWNPPEIIGRLPWEYIHPDDTGIVNAAVQDLEQGKSPMEITVRFRRKNGDYAIVDFSGDLVRNDGAAAGIQVIGRDVTERRRIEDVYRDTSRRFAEIIDSLPDPTMVVDKDGVVVAWNRALELMSGIPASAMLGKGDQAYTAWIAGNTGPILIDYILRRDIEGIKTAYPQSHFEGNTVKSERVVTRTDGTRFSLWISATPLIDQNGEVTGAIESVRDVTHQKKISHALRESRQFLETIINTIPVRVFWKDKNLTFLGCNTAFARDAGFETAGDVIGKDDYAMGWRDQAELYRADDRAVIESGKPKLLIEEPQTTPAGELIFLLTSKVPVKNETSQTIGVLGTYLDVTERKLAEEALRLANKKLNLLSGITRHDIRNQLLGLEGYLEISKETLDDPVLTAGFIAKEEKIAQTIAHQISFTKDYEDMGVKAPVWQKVNTVISNVIGRLPLRNIRVDAGDPDLEVFADPLLEKVFFNLVDNALRYGGEKMTAIRVTNRDDSGNMIITVEDDGMGVFADDKKQLFTRGFGKNTGLGLYLSREILAITGITISETGTPGMGARFEIRVPKGGYRFVRTGPEK